MFKMAPLVPQQNVMQSNNVKTVLGSGTQYANGFAVADIERSSLILCGKAFANSAIVKDALAAMTAPILSARGGLPVPGWIMSFGGSIVLLFALVEIMMSCTEIHNALLSIDCGAVISSKGSTVLFPTKASREQKLLTEPTGVIIVSSDSSGVIPSVCKLSPGQAAYHFLAGYHDGKFVPAYTRAPSPADPLALAISLFSHLKEDDTPAYLINAKHSGKYIGGNITSFHFKLCNGRSVQFDVGNVVMVTRNTGCVGVIKNWEKHKGIFEVIDVLLGAFFMLCLVFSYLLYRKT
ncbi:hypothetical protein ZEAMMB73_Zm00001d009327 [Zea mays]|uniref:40S ribosomal protein S4 n=1 Tax=Zea mays TaxID=4577 RepID=A0A1D6FIS5_MAIZE|nr:hypothetical protein ZEAMMB73_Zm00001d009327 [Zea mays]